jgi:ABC-type iron transport system FetAB ATPase subunit
MWRLFHQFHFTAKISSSWAPIEEIFKTYEPEVITIPLPFDDPILAINKYMKLDLHKDTKEIQFHAESGGGKSTMLTNMAIMFSKLYGNVFNYMPQNVNVINSDNMTILDYFGLNLPIDTLKNHKKELIKIALNLADDLNVGKNWFNEDSISKPLDRIPSGGEEKRIALIQTILLLFLQIKLKLPYKKLLLVDEATSGLDKKNFELVRDKIFKTLVTHGIIMVYIDHHENNDIDIVPIDIIKEEIVADKRLPEIRNEIATVWSTLSNVLIGTDDFTDKKYYEPIEVRIRPIVNGILRK